MVNTSKLESKYRPSAENEERRDAEMSDEPIPTDNPFIDVDSLLK
jgi:hypothetical protein